MTLQYITGHDANCIKLSKKVHSRKYGYLNMAVNYPEIFDQAKLIKHLVRSFNNGREKIIKYRDTVLTFHKMKPTFLKLNC